MSKYFLFFCIGLLSLGCACASDLDFTIVSQTSRSFEAIYISASDDPDWDGNLLSNQQTLAEGGKLAVKFDETEESETWDLKVVDSDGVTVTFKDVNLAEVDIVTLNGRGR